MRWAISDSIGTLVLFADFCDIPELMTHLQNNYKFWKSEEENPTANYDLSIKGQQDVNDNNDNKSEQSVTLTTTENSNSNNGENTWWSCLVN